MAHIDRDYTPEVLAEITAAVDAYVGKSGEADIIEWLFPRKGAKEYIWFLRDMGNEKDEVKLKITRVLKKIEEEEKNFSKDFSNIEEEIAAMKDILDRLASEISFKRFSTLVDFYKVALGDQGKVQDYMEAKSEQIMKKPPQEWTDEEYEIVAYAYISSTDDEFKCQVINCFYSDSTDKHIIDERRLQASDGKSNIKYFDRDEESWNKFRNITALYYANEYDRYLNGDPNDEAQSRKFETAMENYLVIENYNSDEYSTLVSKHDNPFKFEDGSFQANIAKYDKIEMKDGGIYLDGKPGLVDVPYNSFEREETLSAISVKSDYSVQEVSSGKEAGKYIDNEFKEDALETESPMKGTVNSVLNAGLGAIYAGMDILIPGSGTAAGAIIDTSIAISENANAEEEKERQYRMASLSQFANAFGIGIAFTSEGVLLYNTPTSIKKLNDLIQELKEEKPVTYDYFKGDRDEITPESFINGEIDICEFSDQYF